MRRAGEFIPDHSREAVSEALEAALYRAAFQRLEEKEMKDILKTLRGGEGPCELTARTRRRLNRRRGWTALRRALPRIAQAAAAFIAVVSIGAGIALAASPAARQWAAGVLYSRVTDPDGFFGEVRSSVTDGAVLNGRLALAEETAISLYDSADAQPTVYQWRDPEDRVLAALATDGDEAWVLYSRVDRVREAAFDLDGQVVGYGLGRVRFGRDDFEVEQLAYVPATDVLDPEGRTLEAWGIDGCALRQGGLYFAAWHNVREAGRGFSFAPQSVRLFRWDLSGGELAELDLAGLTFDWEAQLFGGAGGVFLAASDDGAAATGVYRVEGTRLVRACQVPYAGVERPTGFAWREGDDALLYILDGSAYLAPGMDPSKAVRVAVCGELSGRGLLLDESAYAVVGGSSVSLFDLSVPLGEVNELVVDGDSGNDVVNETFIAEHPGVAIISDPNQSLGEPYHELMLAGKASGDAVILDWEDFQQVRDAGLIAPLTDPALVAEWEKLPAGLREFLSANGQPAAIPQDVYAYPDVMLLPQAWEEIRGSFGDYPETWLEYARWLAEFSRGPLASKYAVDFDLVESEGTDAPELFEIYTLWHMADAFGRCWRALGEDVDFTRPEFVECVEALDAVDWKALQYGDGYVDGEDRRAMLFLSTYDINTYNPELYEGCLTLKIRPDAPKLTRASGYFAFVPAASTQKATAQEYLEVLVRVNHGRYEGDREEAAYYDFATDPQVLAEESGEYSAEAIRRYRRDVGDMAIPPIQRRETVRAVRDAMTAYAQGKLDVQALAKALGEAYP